MTKNETLNLIAMLRGAFPRGEFPQESVAVYVADLGDLDAAHAAAAVTELVRTSRFLPTLAEIRELVAESSCGLPSVEDAWAEVERALRRYDAGDSRTWTYPDDFSSELVARALAAVGGLPRLDTTPTFSTDRREFLRTYAELRRAAVKGAQVSRTACTAIEGRCPQHLLPTMKHIDEETP